MNRPARILLILLLVAIVMLPAVLLTWAGVTVYRAGTLSVEVNEPGPRGGNVHVVLPAGAVEVALAFLPSRVIPEEAREQIEPYVSVAGRLADSFSRLPDAVFVAIDAPYEQVRIAKEGSDLVIRVVDCDQSVHVRIPWRTLTAVLHYVESAAA